MGQTAKTSLHATTALLSGGWATGVRITVTDGTIARIETGVSPQSGDEIHSVLLPAMPNLHSHAFQRAMAGLAEVRGPDSDSFWSWRSIMYKFALSMTPDQMQAVAAQLYMEMLEAGFSRVGEFHYLHHDKDGRPYANIAELAERIGAASAEAGIGLTLLPVFYAHSGFGGADPLDGQRRFINSVDSFAHLMDGCERIVAGLDGAVLGVAPHSLRAVTPQELEAVVPLAKGGPVHIHVAEQVKEVEDCVAWSGARPVEWLLENAPVDERWCLIHATHMTEDETRQMARRQAIAGLCPITEANLGDGTFGAPLFLAEAGRFGIGSDSNVLISLPGELRQLEYSQRLARRARNVVAEPGRSTGRQLFDQALVGGAAALGTQTGLSVGKPADLVSLDTTALPYLSEDQLLDHWIFAGGVEVDSVWVRGRKQVTGGRHVRRAEIEGPFVKTMQALMSA
jgi:formiminoglutamate deiminase